MQYMNLCLIIKNHAAGYDFSPTLPFSLDITDGYPYIINHYLTLYIPNFLLTHLMYIHFSFCQKVSITADDHCRPKRMNNDESITKHTENSEVNRTNI